MGYHECDLIRISEALAAQKKRDLKDLDYKRGPDYGDSYLGEYEG